MGTRSTTRIIEGGKPLICLYGQFDGYVNGHGHDVARILKDGHLVNGYLPGDNTQFNGMGDLAVRLITGLKSAFADGPGNYYIFAADSEPQGYDYEISEADDRRVRIKVTRYGDVIFEGTPDELLEFDEVDEE